MAEMRAQLANRAPTMPPTGPATTEGSVAPAVAKAPSIGAARSVTEPSERGERLDGVHRADSADASYWLGWTTLGAGGIVIGVSGLLFFRASSLRDQGNTEPDMKPRVVLHDQTSTRTVIGAVVGAGGAVLTATGLVLLVTHSRDRARARTASWDIGTSGHGIVVFGRF